MKAINNLIEKYTVFFNAENAMIALFNNHIRDAETDLNSLKLEWFEGEGMSQTEYLDKKERIEFAIKRAKFKLQIVSTKQKAYELILSDLKKTISEN
jgi:hypothetical protein